MVTYNHQNLPLVVSKSNGDKVRFIYDATGSRLEQLVESGGKTTRTDYNGFFVYTQEGQQQRNHLATHL